MACKFTRYCFHRIPPSFLFLSKNIYNFEAKDIQDEYFSFLVFSSSSFFISWDLLQFRRSVVTMQAYLMSFRGARLITVFESDGTNV